MVGSKVRTCRCPQPGDAEVVTGDGPDSLQGSAVNWQALGPQGECGEKRQPRQAAAGKGGEKPARLHFTVSASEPQHPWERCPPQAGCSANSPPPCPTVT